MYHTFKSQLRDSSTYPSGAPDLVKYRSVDMYTSCTEPKVKESILLSFRCENGTLRVIIATIAFEIGLDCPNTREVIHWGPSSDLESCTQEAGRAGRAGYLSHATLMYGADDRRYCNPEMMLYVENEKNRRRQLLLC